MEILNPPGFIQEQKPKRQSKSNRSSNFNDKFLIDELASCRTHVIKKQEVNDAFQINSCDFSDPVNDQINPQTLQHKCDISNEMAHDSILESNGNNTPMPVKMGIISIKKSLSVPLPAYVPLLLAGYFKAFVRSRRKKFEKIKINLGPTTKQDPIYGYKDNYISTTK